MGKVTKKNKKASSEEATPRISARSWSEELAYQLRTDKKFAKLLSQKLIRDGEDPKRVMKDEYFRGLLQSVRQMGDYLKGKKVPGMRKTSRSSSATASKRRSKAK